MSSEQMRSRIESQPASLRCVLAHQYGAGADALQKAAKLIRTSKQVVITGMGASFYAVLPLESYLCGLGISAIAVEAGELLHFRQNAYLNAIFVVVSRSGESIEIAKLLDRVKGRQTVIGVCNRAESRLSRDADVVLSIQSMEDDIVALQTYTGTVLALALLGKTVAAPTENAKAEVEMILPDFERLISGSLALAREWDDFLYPHGTPYLLARGGSFSSALEGALLFHEVSKAPAITMLTASFRHGPVEVVDDNFRAFVFACEGATQSLNAALAHDLVRFGGQVRVIGPQADNLRSLPLIETPAIEAIYAPIFEVVPIQAAALYLAELLGIVAGSFRFAPPVALDEDSFGPSS